MSRARAAAAAVVVLTSAGSLAACTSVLGLDAPVLDSCFDGGCVDAVVPDAIGAADSGTGPDVEAGATDGNSSCMDAQFDGAGGTTIRCGGGCYPVVYCATDNVCCATAGKTGLVFQCASSDTACGAMSGYTIECQNENDCNGNEVCCHYASHTVCSSASTCTSPTDTACVPGSKNDCPSGMTCGTMVTIDDASAPYFTCSN